MKYMRFMGREEYEALMRGEELENHTDWKAVGKNSDSVGFCFFDTLEAPEERLSYALGVISLQTEYCVIFKCKGARLRQGYGTYAKPVDITRIDQIDRTLNHQNILRKKEYSTEHYSNRTMVPVAAGEIVLWGRPREKEYEIEWKDKGEWKQEA